MRYPLSFAQQRLWHLERFAPGDPATRLAHATWLDGSVDFVALQRAMDAMVVRHAALRTRIVTSAGAQAQVVEDTAALPIDRIDLSGDPDGIAKAESIAAELATRPFDLARLPPLRAALIEVSTGRSLFVLVAHRIIADDAALAILLDELSTVSSGDSATLPELWMDYGDYAVWQREWLCGEELARQLAHWRESLRDTAKLALPTDRSVRSPATATIDMSSHRRLTDLAERAGTTSDAVFLAGYALALSPYATGNDFVIVVPVGGRIRPELASIVGPFADAVPVRISPTGATFAELVNQIRDGIGEALRHDELPLDKLADELGTDPADFAARFTFRSQCAPSLALPGMTVSGRLTFEQITESTVDLTASDDGTLTLRHRIDPARADELVRSVVTVLEHALREPDMPQAALPLPTVAPRPASSMTVAPRNPVEAAIAAILAELLPTDRPIGVHDNLFRLGGNSLTAIRLAARLADTYGVHIPMHRIVETPTIADLAGIVTTAGESERDADLVALSDAELDDLLRAVLAARDRRRAGREDQP